MLLSLRQYILELHCLTDQMDRWVGIYKDGTICMAQTPRDDNIIHHAIKSHRMTVYPMGSVERSGATNSVKEQAITAAAKYGLPTFGRD